MTFRAEAIQRLTEHARSGSTHILPFDRATEGLYEGFREDVLCYFAKYDIKWWTSRDEAGIRRAAHVRGLPTGHLTSSQLACVNHLDPLRGDEALALQTARKIDPAIRRVLPVPGEGGFVAYEWLPQIDFLNESTRRTRGANVTSLDGLMLAEREGGELVVIAIEWKFLETYGRRPIPRVSAKGTDRLERYESLLTDRNSPIKRGDPLRLFYEPYYQLMRQTLLVWQLTRRDLAGWVNPTDWLHVHVIPRGHLRLRNHVPRDVAEYQGHSSLESAWRSFLKTPDRYRLMGPRDLVPDNLPERWVDWRIWLSARYGT